MSKNSGYLVKYTNKEGVTQYGIVRHNDQKEEFQRLNKCLVRICNKDFTVKHNESGKEMVVLKSKDLLTFKGFVD